MSRSERVVERLLALCRIPSVTGDEAALGDHVAAQVPAGWPVARVGPSVIVGRPERRDVPWIGLFGHLDTVPPHAGDPSPFVEGDRVVGLGASDMKAGLAVMLELLTALRPGEGPCEPVFVFYDREEGPYAENGLEPVLDALPWLSDLDLGVCLEPSANRLQLGCLGALHAQVTFHGRRAHSARPWEGHNAIHAAAPVLADIAARPIREIAVGGLRYRETMSVTLASGGLARNVVPDRFELNVNYRFGPDKALAEAEADVIALVAGRAEVTFTDACPSGPVAADHPLVRFLIDDLGLAPEAKQAWTDVARLGQRGVAAVNLGPGEPAQAHQARESVSIRLVEEGLRLFETLLARVPR